MKICNYLKMEEESYFRRIKKTNVNDIKELEEDTDTTLVYSAPLNTQLNESKKKII